METLHQEDSREGAGRTSGCCCAQDYRATLVDRIVGMEWGFFQNVNNVGGRAACQDMPDTFSVMRASQFAIWTDEMLLAYYGDLCAARDEGRNPMTEKYGYMMESTHPLEFAEIADALPQVSAEKRALVERIVAIQVRWAREIAAAYPHFAARGRAITSDGDTPEATSLETYSRGELSTYSERTLKLMLEHFSAAAAGGANLQMQVDESTVASYGYPSLAAAEEMLADGCRQGR